MTGNYQQSQWSGLFGKEYTDRNICDMNEMEKIYMKNFGVSRRHMNNIFLSALDKDIPILEVGCNVGNQHIDDNNLVDQMFLLEKPQIK